MDIEGSFKCDCLDDFIETDLSIRLCVACPSGQFKTNKTSSGCKECSFGRSGLNCSDSWQLVLVIVGSVLGGLLLIMVILLPVIALTCKKTKNADSGQSYVSKSTAKIPVVNGNFASHKATPVNGLANGLAAFANTGMPRIPRATTNSSWNSRTTLEMTPSNSRQNLISADRNSWTNNIQDDMNPYPKSRAQTSLYASGRAQNNPYANGRPQNNPYAQNGLQSNPYAQTNGRRFDL
uniref:protein HEG homolog 1-like n=1 Tax=Monopterus albus TaxID=43700 RepID=UPI0009B44754|nr:protein HEG homolog 1-like [Monopterus albus]